MTAGPLLGAGRLDELLAGCAGTHVAVLGDLAVDAYWTADMRMSELSRETPIPVRPVTAETYSPGGGAHVARSLRVLGCRVSAFSVIGTDWRGDLLLRLLADADVETTGVQRTEGVRTVLFGKVLLTADHRQQEDARLDFVNDRPADPDVGARMLAALDAVLPDLQALVVSDYQPVGVVGETVTAWLRGVRATRPGLPLLVDSRDRIGGFDDMVRTPNRQEAAAYLETRTGSAAAPADDAALLTALAALLPPGGHRWS